MLRIAIKIVVGVALLFVLIHGVSGLAAAQEGEQEPPAPIDTGDSGTGQVEYVFEHSNMIESHWDGKTFVAVFSPANSDSASVTMTDSGRSTDDGEHVEMDRETYDLSTDERTEIRFTVEENRYVTIDDGETIILTGHDDSVTVSPDPNSGNITAAIIVVVVLAFGMLAVWGLVTRYFLSIKVSDV